MAANVASVRRFSFVFKLVSGNKKGGLRAKPTKAGGIVINFNLTDEQRKRSVATLYKLGV
jgi:hypothetical protein